MTKYLILEQLVLIYTQLHVGEVSLSSLWFHHQEVLLGQQTSQKPCGENILIEEHIKAQT